MLHQKNGKALRYGNAFDQLGGKGEVYETGAVSSYQITVYKPSFKTPGFFQGANIYQIFPDRFFRAPTKAKDTRTDRHVHENWDEDLLPETDPRGGKYMELDFYGGTLTGIMKKLPYLEKMGVETADSVQRLLRKTEQSFTPDERLSDAPLGRGFLHGYLMMLEALQSRDGLDTDGWKPAHIALAALPATREAAYGALLALENQTERRILDLDKSEEENRPSNAMRFMARAAQRPNEVWAYLQVRMRPYANKYWFTKGSSHQAEKLQAWIEENHWNHDKPLGAEYLYYFYLYNQFDNRKDD